MWDMEPVATTEMKRLRHKANLALSIASVFDITSFQEYGRASSALPKERDTRSDTEVKRRIALAEQRRQRKRQRNLRHKELS